MRYRVRHLITHDTRVRSAEGQDSTRHLQARISPRDTPGQRVVGHTLTIEPAPTDRADHIDLYGNRFTYFTLPAGEATCTVTASTDVELLKRRPLADPDTTWQLAATRAQQDPLMADFLADGVTDIVSLEIDAVRPGPDPDRIATPFLADRPLLDALAALSEYIAKVAAQAGWSPVEAATAAVTQARAAGLAARFVTGYSEAPAAENGGGPDDGAPIANLGLHVWASVRAADRMWIDFDPSAGSVEPVSHITVGWGRNIAEMEALRTLAEGTNTIEVEVRRRGPGTISLGRRRNAQGDR